MTTHQEAQRAISGALFDFAGFLTTRDKVTPFGSSAEAGPMVELLTEWAKKRGLSLDEPAISTWSDAISTQPSEQSEISRLTSELEAARAVLPMTKDERTLMYADVLGFGDSDLQTMNRGDLDNLVDAVLRHVSLAQPSAPPAEQRPTAPKTNFGPYDEDDDISNLMGDDK